MLSYPLALLAWSPRLLCMSISALMQRRCCCSVVPQRCWLGHQVNLKYPQRHCCCSVAPLALRTWPTRLLEMSASATMPRCCCCSVFPLPLPAWSPRQVMSLGATTGFSILTISSFDWDLSKSIIENHITTFFLKWALLLTVVLLLFVWFPLINFLCHHFLICWPP
jgi:hypothetical protein